MLTLFGTIITLKFLEATNGLEQLGYDVDRPKVLMQEIFAHAGSGEYDRLNLTFAEAV